MTVHPDQLPTRLEAVRQRIANAAAAARRPGDSISLLAVSKRHPVSAIRAAAAAGQTAFGENYLDEALDKMATAPDGLEWHFIGPIQSNKTRGIAAHFDWVQSIDRAKILRRLNDQRPTELAPLQCLLQVNIGGEASKSGASAAQVVELLELGHSLDRLVIRGLMSIPPPSDDPEVQRGYCRQLRELFEQCRSLADDRWDTLSMGMSNDLEAAIAEGATLVRVGTDIFGPRD